MNDNDAHDPYFPVPPYDEKVPSDGATRFNGDLWDPRQRSTKSELDGKRLAHTAAGLSRSDIRRARDLHLAELSYADHHFGLLLDELGDLGLLRNTVIVGVSDHGELFGEHGRMSHAGTKVEELLHVPLFV